MNSLVWALSLWATKVAIATTPGLGTPAACARYRGLPAGWGHSKSAGMVWVAGGELVPGTTKGYPEERPGPAVRVPGFWIDRTEVTNAQFADFVAHTNYLTAAERNGGAPVFHLPTAEELQRTDHAWWTFVEGANWRHPSGPASDIRGRENQPVVQVVYEDAQAYARWLGRSLPTEAQWEFAARGGRPDDELQHAPRDPRGTPTANFWQGEFPAVNSAEDGFVLAAPVGCFPANGYGLHDAIGNVWEWTADVYVASHQDHAVGACAAGEARAGHRAAEAHVTHVIKGGSFLCSPNFCARYRVSARHPQEVDMPAMHLGFRTVAAARAPIAARR